MANKSDQHKFKVDPEKLPCPFCWELPLRKEKSTADGRSIYMANICQTPNCPISGMPFDDVEWTRRKYVPVEGKPISKMSDSELREMLDSWEPVPVRYDPIRKRNIVG